MILHDPLGSGVFVGPTFKLDLTLTPNTITLQATETAQAFWATLIPHGLHGGALAHIHSTDDDEDDDMGEGGGWQDEYVQWWFDFLAEKGGKGISKDTWAMVSRSLYVVCLELSHEMSLVFSLPNSCAPSIQSLRNTTWRVSPMQSMLTL